MTMRWPRGRSVCSALPAFEQGSPAFEAGPDAFGPVGGAAEAVLLVQVAVDRLPYPLREPVAHGPADRGDGKGGRVGDRRGELVGGLAQLRGGNQTVGEADLPGASAVDADRGVQHLQRRLLADDRWQRHAQPEAVVEA